MGELLTNACKWRWNVGNDRDYQIPSDKEFPVLGAGMQKAC